MIIDCETIVEALGDLPPTPVVAIKALKIMEDPFATARKVADTICHDTAISARILRIANSPVYSTGQKISTLEHAIVILGEDLLKKLVLETSLRGLNKSFGLAERQLWEDSISAAVGARILANLAGYPKPEEAFLAGLFRHIGKLVLNNHSKQAFKQIQEGVKTGLGTSEDMERGFFAFTHAEVGAAVLEKWRFADALILSTLHHHDMALPEDAPEQTRQLLAIVNLAGGLYNAQGLRVSNSHSEVALLARPGAALLGITLPEIQELIQEYEHIYAQERAFFLS